MKLVLLAILFVSLGFTCLAENFQPDGEPFLMPTNAQVVWGIDMTNMPTELWVYKVYPQSFSPSVIENIFSLGGLSARNRVAKINPPLLILDTNYMQFEIDNERGKRLRRLDIIPAFGDIIYQNSSSNYKDPLETAPTIREIEKFAYEDMLKVGIDRSLIETKPRSYSVSTAERGESPAKTTNEIGISFSRKVNGIIERGYCFSVKYGTLKGEPNLLALTVNWKNLVPYSMCSIADTNDIIQLLKSGLTKAPDQPDDVTSISRVKKLTITKCDLIYFGNTPRQKVDYEYPYAELTVVGDLDETNKATYYLNCPIIREKQQ